MANFYPVYKEIAALLNDDPECATDLELDQLEPIIHLSQSAPSVLLDSHVLDRVQEIYQQRTSRKTPRNKPTKVTVRAGVRPVAQPRRATPRKVKVVPKSIASVVKVPSVKVKVQRAGGNPTVKPRVKPVAKPVASSPSSTSTSASASTIGKCHDETINSVIMKLNNDYGLAKDMDQDSLEYLIKWSDEKYYLDPEGVELLNDKVYDYVKRVYTQRRFGTNTKISISSKTGVGIKPTRGRDTVLPVALRSLDDLFIDEGDVKKWVGKTPTAEFLVAAKMDGMSGLYHKGRLYSRGDATTGRDITHVLQFIKLPKIPDNIAVRGELVMNRHVFDKKYKGNPSPSGTIRKYNRNSVAGSVGTINHIDPAFLSDLTFAVYELINMDQSKPQLRPSEQYEKLTAFGFITAFHVVKPRAAVNDADLSTVHHELLDNYDYIIDGLVLFRNEPYLRQSDKNPDYGKAFKEALDTDVAVTEVTKVVWKTGQHGYLTPTVHYNKVFIGVENDRATGYNAKFIKDNGIGPGAKVEVIWWAKVNPRINKVITPAKPSMPSTPYVWVDNGGDPAEIMLAGDIEENDEVKVQRITKFMETINAAGVREKKVQRIYDAGLGSIGDFINMTAEDISFMGSTESVKIVTAINTALHKADLPVLMAASKKFARGLGRRKFNKVFEMYPDFAETRRSTSEYVTLFLTVEGFAGKTAERAAEGMEEFWQFVDDEVPDKIYQMILGNTKSKFVTTPPPATANQKIAGKQIVFTGCRAGDLQEYIESNGGKVQAKCSSKTDIVVRKSDSFESGSTKCAVKYGIILVSLDTFKSDYVS